MKMLNVSSIREMIGDSNRFISEANNQLLEIDERIEKINSMSESDDLNYDMLNSLLLKKDVLKSDIIYYEEKINVCNKLLYDFALNSALSKNDLLDRIISRLIEMKNDEIDCLEFEKDYYKNELLLRKDCSSLYSFKGRSYMFESLISTPISKEQYLKYFINELNDSGLMDSIYGLMMKYDSNFSNYIDVFKNVDVNQNIDMFFDEYSLNVEWKKFFHSLKFYAEVLENYKFIEKLNDCVNKYGNLDCFEGKIYFPGFKCCTIDDIKNTFDSLEDGDLKNYISQFDFNNLSLLDIYCIVYKFNLNRRFILNNEGFIGDNDLEIYKLSKLESIDSKAIEFDKKLIDDLSGKNKVEALSKYFGGLSLHHDFLPIDFHANMIIDDINKVVDDYKKVELEKNKFKDMIDCYERGSLFPLFDEFGSDKEKFRIGKEVLSTDILKNIVIDLNNFNLNIKRKKGEVNSLLNDIESINKNIDSSKLELDEWNLGRDNFIFTRRNGKVIKNKFFRFFFKFSRQYKDNVFCFESKKSALEKVLNDYKGKYSSYFEKMNSACKLLEELNSDKDNYILDYNSKYDGIIDKALRYNTYLDNNGYDMYMNYINLKKSFDLENDKIYGLKNIYLGRLSELLCVSNLSDDFISNVNNIIDSDELVKLDYVDKNSTDYYSMIYDRYRSDEYVFDSLVTNNYDFQMDDDEVVYGLVGKIKKKFR